MSQRVEISEAAFKTAGVGSANLQVASGASVTVKDLSGNNLTVYQAATGSSTHSNPLTTDANGRIEGWVEAPDFDLTVSGTGITMYTQYVRTSPFFDVRSYGADPLRTAAQNRAAVNSTIGAAVTAGGGDVRVLGTYELDTSALVQGNGVRLFGTGRGSVLRAAAGWSAANPLVDANNGATGVQGFVCEGIYLDCDWKANIGIQVNTTTGGETDFNWIRHCRIEKHIETGILLGSNGFEVPCHVKDCFIGEGATSNGATTRKGVWVKPGGGSVQLLDLRINNHRQAAIYGEAGGLQILGGHIFGHGVVWTAGQYPTGVKLVRGGGSIISGVYFDCFKQNEAIVIAPDTAAQAINNILVVGNYFIQTQTQRNGTDTANAQYSVVHVDATTAAVSTVKIANNTGIANTTTRWSNILKVTGSPSVVKLVDNDFLECDAFASTFAQLRAFRDNSITNASGTTHSGTLSGAVHTLTDGTTVSVDTAKGNYFYLNVAANANRTISFPSNVQAGMEYEFEIRNGSGGAYSATFTWAASYKLAGAWTMPANGASRTVRFRARDTGQLIEVGRSAADIITNA